MKGFWSGVITAAVVATVGLGAQGAQEGQSSPAAPAGAAAAQAGQGAAAPAQAGAQQKIMVSGCVQNAPAAAGAPAAGSPTFVLADAKMASGAGAAQGGAVGTSGAAATRYELDGDAKTISPHLNHQVEITGTLQSSAPSPGAPGAAADAKAPAPRLKVESVKMVSATCP